MRYSVTTECLNVGIKMKLASIKVRFAKLQGSKMAEVYLSIQRKVVYMFKITNKINVKGLSWLYWQMEMYKWEFVIMECSMAHS
jgi:hypothetical protein